MKLFNFMICLVLVATHKSSLVCSCKRSPKHYATSSTRDDQMLRAVISNLGLRMHSRGVASLRSNPGIYSIIIRTLYFVVHKMRADGSVALHIV